jgi:hypothetical protein
MTSIPQLRKDIADLQSQLADARKKIKELESRKPEVKTVYVDKPVQVIKRVEVPVPGPVKYVDRPVEVIKEKRIEVPVDRVITRTVTKEVPVEKIVYKEKRVEVLKQVIKVVEKEVPGPVRHVTKEIPGPVEYRDNPKHIEMIRRLQRAAGN